jgi:hypothetical protein
MNSVRELLAAARSTLAERLPWGWSVVEAERVADGNPRVDAALQVRAPGAEVLEIGVAARQLLDPRDIVSVQADLSEFLSSGPQRIGLVASRYLAPSTRDRLVEAGLSYIDATGNVHVQAGKPAIFIADRGADRDPWRGPGRPRGTLTGGPAAQVVRALVDIPGPWKVTDLVAASRASTGSLYRVLEFLETEALVTRTRQGKIVAPDWQALLRRWSIDYQFLTTNTVTRWIAPRGVKAFFDQVLESGRTDYAVTGSAAAATWAPYAPVRSAMIYCTHPEQAAEHWELRSTESGVNVLLASPAFEVFTDRSAQRPDGLRLAAPAQVAVDLMTGPGRAPSEAEELMDWMKNNEHAWR